MNRKADDGRRIRAIQCTTSDLQVAWIARDIRLAIAGSSQSPAPLTYGSFLVLCPTTTFVDTAITHLTDRYDIPAHKPTGSRIPDDLWPLLLLLRILNNEDPLALRQWLPSLGFSTGEIHSIRASALAQDAPFYAVAMTREDPRIERFIHTLGALRSAAADQASFRQLLAQVHGLPPQDTFAQMLDSILPGTHDSLPSFGRLIHLLYTSLGVFDPGEEVHKQDKVLVANLHSAKGLEAEFVYCPWMTHRFMPMPARDPSEQRRVLYVAMTRAKRDLCVLFHEEFDNATRRRLYQRAMSPFLLSICDRLRVERIRAGDLG